MGEAMKTIPMFVASPILIPTPMSVNQTLRPFDVKIPTDTILLGMGIKKTAMEETIATTVEEIATDETIATTVEGTVDMGATTTCPDVDTARETTFSRRLPQEEACQCRVVES